MTVLEEGRLDDLTSYKSIIARRSAECFVIYVKFPGKVKVEVLSSAILHVTCQSPSPTECILNISQVTPLA